MLARGMYGVVCFSCVRRLENARNGSDRSYHVWSGLIERASSVLVFIMVFRHDMSHL